MACAVRSNCRCLRAPETRLARTVAAGRHDHYCDYRIVRPDDEVRWIESRSLISYDGDGPRLVGANIDVTDRKTAERDLDERNMQLSLAGKAAGVVPSGRPCRAAYPSGSYAYDLNAYVMQATKTTREWRA
jgi:hypothetical protein